MNGFLKRAFFALLVLYVLGPMLLTGAVCGLLVISELFPAKPRYDVFDDSEILIEVMTQTPYGKEEDKAVHYFALADGQRIRETAPFAPEPMTVYTVPGPSEVYVRQMKEHTETKASFTTLGLQDEDGSTVPLTEDFTAILKRLDEIDHWVMTAKIMEVQGRLFVSIELNVNLWDPRTLYQYDPDTRQLTELYTWDNQEPVGLRLRGAASEATGFLFWYFN